MIHTRTYTQAYNIYIHVHNPNWRETWLYCLLLCFSFPTFAEIV